MLWSILKVVQLIAIANNNYIHISKGDIYIVFWKLQDKTPHALRDARSSTVVYICIDGENKEKFCE